MKLSEMSIVELMAWKYLAYKGNATSEVVDAIQQEVDHRIAQLSRDIEKGIVEENLRKAELQQQNQMKEALSKWENRYKKTYAAYFAKTYAIIRESEAGKPLSVLFEDNMSILKQANICKYIIYDYNNNTSTDTSFLIGTKQFKKDSQELREVRKALGVSEEEG